MKPIETIVIASLFICGLLMTVGGVIGFIVYENENLLPWMWFISGQLLLLHGGAYLDRAS